MVGTGRRSAGAAAHRTPGNCLVNGIDLDLFEIVDARAARRHDRRSRSACRTTTRSSARRATSRARASASGCPTSSGRYVPRSTPVDLGLNLPFASMVGPRQIGPDLTWRRESANSGVDRRRSRAGAGRAGPCTTRIPIGDTGNITKDDRHHRHQPVAHDRQDGLDHESGRRRRTSPTRTCVTTRARPPMPMNQVARRATTCARSPTYASGDNGDGLLSNGEGWIYTCTSCTRRRASTPTPRPRARLSTVGRATGLLAARHLDGHAHPAAGRASGRPQVAVKPTTAAQAPCTLATPSGLRVRAGQLNTIRVRVRNVDAGSTVTITLPGGKKVHREDELQRRRDAAGRARRSPAGQDPRRRVLRGRAPVRSVPHGASSRRGTRGSPAS